MRGHRVHAHRSIAHQRRPPGNETRGVHRYQRVHVAGAGHRHLAALAAHPPLQVRGQGRVVHRFGPVHLRRAEGQHRRRQVSVQRQQRQRVAVVEPLPGRMVVGNGVLEPAHHHPLAVVAHRGADAEHAPHLREAAVGGHQQPGADDPAVLQRGLDAGAALGHRLHAAAGHQLQAVLPGHRLEHGAPDHVVGHQPAKPLAAAIGGADPQRVGGVAVADPGVAQLGDIGGIKTVPQAKLLQDPARGVGQRDLAAVERRLFDRLQRLLLHHRHRQPAAGQRTGKAQPRRTGPHDNDIELHANASRLVRTASLRAIVGDGIDPGQDRRRIATCRGSDARTRRLPAAVPDGPSPAAGTCPAHPCARGRSPRPGPPCRGGPARTRPGPARPAAP